MMVLEMGGINQRKRQDKLIHIEIFKAYVIYKWEVLTRIHKCVPADKIYAYCSMNKQYMKGVQKK